jgi:hypothetical protein
MKIKYLGPSPSVNVGGFGPHPKDAVVDYPDEVAEELLATSKKQKFEAVDSGSRPPEPATPEEILEAAKKVIEAGDVTQDSKPKTEAIMEILGKKVSASERDEAWEKIEAEKEGDE